MNSTPFDPRQVVANLQKIVAQADANSGLDIVLPTAADSTLGLMQVVLTQRLLDWLLDLRLLRHVPLSYLVPDPALLPTESIRFFHVDPTWSDRLIDGAMAAGNLGTVDMSFSIGTLAKLRTFLDDQLGVGGTGDGAVGITGMLIRSDLVARWPDMIVSASAGTGAAQQDIAILRKDVLSTSVMIVLFAGSPDAVGLREPHVGLRFGVEPKSTDQYELPLRDPATGGFLGGNPIPVPMCASRLLDVATLMGKLPAPPTTTPALTRASRDVAITLQRPPYKQTFSSTVDWTTGSELPYVAPAAGSTGTRTYKTIQLSNGKTLALDTVLNGLANLDRLPGGK